MAGSIQTPVVILLFNIIINLAGVVANTNDGVPLLVILENDDFFTEVCFVKIDLDNASNYVKQTELIRGDSMFAFDYDYEKGLLFYSNFKSIKRANFIKTDTNMSLGNFETVASTNVNFPNSICVDWINERIYWTDIFLNRIDVTNYDGSQRVSLFSSDIDKPGSISVDPFTGLMFWTNWGTHYRIERATMSGDDRMVIVHTNVLNGLVLDIEEKRLYFVDTKFDAIESLNYDGSDRKKVLSDRTSLISAFGLQIHEEYIYWNVRSSQQSSINRADKKTGKNVAVYFKNFTSRVYMLRLFHPRKENEDFKVCDDECSPCEPHEMCLSSPRTNVEGQVTHKCVSTSNSQSAEIEITEKDYPLLTGADQMKLTLIQTNGSAEQANVPGIYALDYSFDTQTVFFSDLQRRQISSVSIKSNGTADTLVTDVECDSPEGLAFDWVHGLIYWLNTKQNTINVYSTNSSSWTTIIQRNLSRVRAIEVDPLSGWLFWTDCGSSPKIERSALDGAGRQTILSESIVCPNALTLDGGSKIIFFYDLSRQVIEKMDYQGANRRTILTIPASITKVNSLDVYKDYLYWTEGNEIKGVRECNGAPGKTVQVSGVTTLTSIRVFHKHKQAIGGRNICDSHNCSYLCLPTRNESSQQNSYTCAIPNAQSSLSGNSIASNLGIHNLKIDEAVTIASFLMMLCFQLF